jgi:hypothetical protein
MGGDGIQCRFILGYIVLEISDGVCLLVFVGWMHVVCPHRLGIGSVALPL